MYHQKIRSYAAAAAYLAGKVNRPLAHNTRIKANGNTIIITYHDNPIVEFGKDYVSLSSCGWKTITTKERLNWCIPDGWYLYQEAGVWYIRNRDNDTVLVFADGITFYNDGRIEGMGSPSENQRIKALTKQVKKYVKGFIKALLNGEVESPSSGDCWYCCMHTESGESLGDASHNSDHILNHMEESYYVPSLLVNAVNTLGASLFVKSIIGNIWANPNYSISNWEGGILERDLTSILTRYVKRQLGIAA